MEKGFTFLFCALKLRRLNTHARTHTHSHMHTRLEFVYGLTWFWGKCQAKLRFKIIIIVVFFIMSSDSCGQMRKWKSKISLHNLIKCHFFFSYPAFLHFLNILSTCAYPFSCPVFLQYALLVNYVCLFLLTLWSWTHSLSYYSLLCVHFMTSFFLLFSRVQTPNLLMKSYLRLVTNYVTAVALS